MYFAAPTSIDSATINPTAQVSPDAANTKLTSILTPTSLPSQAQSPLLGASQRSWSLPDHQAAPTSGQAADQGDPNWFQHRRPMKSSNPSNLADAPGQVGGATAPHGVKREPPVTPQSQNAPLPGGAGNYQPGPPAPASAPAPAPAPAPVKTTPTKTTLKALPTVRDHTTDQLNPAGDEYLPRESDEFGEKKVMANGTLLGGREYRVRTFLVPNRGDKLFMLATECARVLGYRDSYLLFNKNRSLYKIIASQLEKDDLVNQEILPFSYRSRQIAIVTARSMFRQFGSRVIVGGRRVRDDYWETKARKQGFTEADPAGEKRPGAAKAREQAQAEQTHNHQMMMPHGEIVYSNNPAPFPGAPQPLVQPDYNESRARDYGAINLKGPRQEITGPPYQDQTRPSSVADLSAQAHQAAEFNRSISQQRDARSDYMRSMWRQPHEQPATTSLTPAPSASESSVPATSRPSQSPHQTSSGMMPSQSPQMMMTAAPYSQSIHAQNPISQAPIRGGSSGSLSQSPSYSYPQSSQMWPQGPAAPQSYSPAAAYTTQGQSAQQSPAPQLRHQASGGMQPGMQFSSMPAMNQPYPGGQSMYAAEQTPRQYMSQNPQASPAVTQAWSNQQPPTQQWWANPQSQ